MEAAIGGEAPQLYYGANSTGSRAAGKRTLEWDLKEWRWDGDLFLATPLDLNRNYQLDSSNSSSDELNQEKEKRRRAGAAEDDLTLNLRGVTGKKTKLGGAAFQVEGFGGDLSKAKDYHRRHKVCETHSKASEALVANQMQRFCQQCSRFHALQEFDEGKRSCRRHLAGHNKRRRKTQQSENVSNNSTVVDTQSSGYLLIAILKILSNLHSNRSNHKDDQDLLSHLLQNLGSQGSSHRKESHDLLNNFPSLGNSELLSVLLSSGSPGQRSLQEHCTTPGDEMPRNDADIHAMSQRQGIVLNTQAGPQISAQDGGSSGERSKLNNFDLNDVYVDSDDATDYIERSNVPESPGTVSIECPSWVQHESLQPSPPQTNRNSESASAQTPSSSSGEDQSHTDRIVFKLFGKEPSGLPLLLRAQIFDWLSHSPSDIESYISDLSSSLHRLLNFADDVKFWSTGWIYARVQNQIGFVYNGQEVFKTSLPYGSDNYSTILSVKPIAVTSSAQAEFVVKGINLSRPSTRLLCALEGNYMEAHCESMEHVDGLEGHVQCLKFSCSVPAVTGRGFIEVEDNNLSSSFSPFIVAEYNVCTEIRMLEREIELTEADNSLRGSGTFSVQKQAMEFIHEMGWLFHKFQLKSRLGHEHPNVGLFSFERFNSLVKFSMDRSWCSVVNKLLDILFYGVVSGGPFLKFALSEMCLLHRAVRRNSRSLVEMLLSYVPEEDSDELSLEYKSLVEIDQSSLFRPDVAGPGGLTPLHVAADRDGSEDILDALTDDPRKIGLEAWKSAVDSTGSTPEDYARLRGHYSYIHLVQRKINKNTSSGHVIVNISETIPHNSINQKPDVEEGGAPSFGIGTFEIKQHLQRPCGVCAQKLTYRIGSRTMLYRPAMVSMCCGRSVCMCGSLFQDYTSILYDLPIQVGDVAVWFQLIRCQNLSIRVSGNKAVCCVYLYLYTVCRDDEPTCQ